MSDSGGGNQFKTRLIVGIIIAVVIASTFIGWGLLNSAQYEWQADANTGHYSEYTRKKIAESCVGIAAPEKAKCVYEARDQEREYRYNQRDLVAQRRSALWAYVMAVAAVIGMALSALGVWLVKTTFDETRRSNEIANDARRPWVTVGISEPFVSKTKNGILLVCTVDLGNIGATPAFNASVDSALGPGTRNPICDFQIIAENVDIAHGEEKESLIILPNGSAQTQIFIDLKPDDPRHPFDHGVVPRFIVWANYSLPDGTRAHSSAWFTVCPEVTCDAHAPMFYWDHTQLRDDEDVIEIESHGYIRVT